jgi:hypothetical protein
MIRVTGFAWLFNPVVRAPLQGSVKNCRDHAGNYETWQLLGSGILEVVRAPESLATRVSEN